METWSFNFDLMRRLSDALDITASEIARRCGIRQQTISQYVAQKFVISVQTLMEICNKMRMPIYFFISENGTHLFPPREEITLSPQRFQPISWDSEAVEDIFGDKPGSIYWKEVAKAMCVTEQKPHDRFTLKTRFPITDFLHTCSALDVSPYHFLIDPNRKGGQPRPTRRKKFAAGFGVPRGVPAADTDALLRDMAALREHLAAMERHCAQLEERCKTVEKQYKTLLAAHNTLAHRVSVSIDTINNSYLSIAADAPLDYSD